MLILQCKECKSIISEVTVMVTHVLRSDLTVSVLGNCIVENDREYFQSDIECVIFHCINCGGICINENRDPFITDFIRDGKIDMKDLTKTTYGKRIKVIKKYTTVSQMNKKLKQLLGHI